MALVVLHDLFVWLYLILLLAWRRLMLSEESCLRKLLSVCSFKWISPQLTHHPFFEWWFLAILCLAASYFQTFLQIFWIDYVGYKDLLDSLTSNFTKVVDGNFACLTDEYVTTFDNRTITVEDLREELAIPDWLKGVAMAAPLIGVTSFLIILVHIWVFVHKNKEEREKAFTKDDQHPFMLDTQVSVTTNVFVEGWVNVQKAGKVIRVTPEQEDLPYQIRYEDGTVSWHHYDDVRSIPAHASNPWIADSHEDLALIVILVPAIWTLLAMNSEVRVLQVMTGHKLDAAVSWRAFDSAFMGNVLSNLTVGAAFQYFAIKAFVNLCTKFFHLGALERLVHRREEHLRETIGHLECPEEVAKDTVLTHIQKESSKQETTMSSAGLLGAWAYIYVGGARSIFGLVVAILIQLDVHSEDVSAVQAMVNDKIQVALLCYMILCIYNMYIVLKIDDLTAPEAFGQNPGVKFLALRALLIISDGQPKGLDVVSEQEWLPSYLHFSVYQKYLIHVSLLAFECLLVAMFNTYMWRQSIRARTIDAKKALGRAIHVAEQNVCAFLHNIKEPVFITSVILPTVATALVILTATIGYTGPPKEPLPFAIGAFDKYVFKVFGTALVLPVMAVRIYVMRDLGFGFWAKGHTSRFMWLPRSWVWGPIFFFALVSMTRLIIYKLTHPFHDYFSDHVLLNMATSFLLALELAFGHVALEKEVRSGLKVLLSGWLVLGLTLANAWITAHYYHEPRAVWKAFCTGIALFLPTNAYWVGLLILARRREKENRVGRGSERLLSE